MVLSNGKVPILKREGVTKMPDKLTDNELFKVGDCVASTVCPNMIGTIIHISNECEETQIVVAISGKEILGDANLWRRVKVERK